VAAGSSGKNEAIAQLLAYLLNLFQRVGGHIIYGAIGNGLGMGIAATLVLLGSNIIVSAVRSFIPSKIRIPCYIVIIATFVTIIELLLKFARRIASRCFRRF